MRPPALTFQIKLTSGDFLKIGHGARDGEGERFAASFAPKQQYMHIPQMFLIHDSTPPGVEIPRAVALSSLHPKLQVPRELAVGKVPAVSAPKAAFALKVHYHIWWCNSAFLDWQAFASFKEAEAVAKHLVRGDETYTIEPAGADCKRCFFEDSLRRNAAYNDARKARIA